MNTTHTVVAFGTGLAVQGKDIFSEKLLCNYIALYRTRQRLTSRPTYTVEHRDVFACCTGYQQVSAQESCSGDACAMLLFLFVSQCYVHVCTVNLSDHLLDNTSTFGWSLGMVQPLRTLQYLEEVATFK